MRLCTWKYFANSKPFNRPISLWITWSLLGMFQRRLHILLQMWLVQMTFKLHSNLESFTWRSYLPVGEWSLVLHLSELSNKGKSYFMNGMPLKTLHSTKCEQSEANLSKLVSIEVGSVLSEHRHLQPFREFLRHCAFLPPAPPFSSSSLPPLIAFPCPPHFPSFLSRLFFSSCSFSSFSSPALSAS